MTTAVLHQLRRHRQRRVYFSSFRIVETFRHHAHDCAHDAVYRDRFVEDVFVAAEASLPQTVRDDRDLVLAWLILFGREVAADDRLNAGHVEKVRSDEKSLDAFGWIDAGEICAPPTIEGELIE